MSTADSSYIPPEQKARQRIDAMLEAAGWVVQDYKAVNLYAGHRRGGAGAGHQRRAGRLRAVRQPPGGRRDRGEEEGHDPVGRRVADGQVPGQRARRAPGRTSSTVACRSATSRPATRRGSPAGWTPSRPRGGCSGSTGPRRSSGRSRTTSTTAAARCGPGSRTCPTSSHDPARLRDAQFEAITQPRAVAEGQPPAGADPDGDRVGQDVRGGEHLRAADPPRPGQAHPVPGRPRQPRPADAQGVPGLRGARLGPQVHRALQRAAPHPQPDRPGGERVHRHDPARVLDAARRGRAARGPRRGVRLRARRPTGRSRSTTTRRCRSRRST